MRGPLEVIASLICVVDDDESVREALGSLIRSVGYKCAVFPSAEAFLGSDCLVETDCMVLDVQLPGLSGLERQLRLRELNCPVPTIFVTGEADDELRRKALKEGAVALFGKPFTGEALLGAIRSALHAPSVAENLR